MRSAPRPFLAARKPGVNEKTTFARNTTSNT
jgi:hypothetical protein